MAKTLRFGFLENTFPKIVSQQNRFFVLCTPCTLPHLCTIKENKRGSNDEMTSSSMTRNHRPAQIRHFS
jgi:hypothetical protein